MSGEGLPSSFVSGGFDRRGLMTTGLAPINFAPPAAVGGPAPDSPPAEEGVPTAVIVGGAIGFMLLTGLVIYGFAAKKPKRRRR
jgi:hypothetical protein